MRCVQGKQAAALLLYKGAGRKVRTPVLSNQGYRQWVIPTGSNLRESATETILIPLSGMKGEKSREELLIKRIS